MIDSWGFYNYMMTHLGVGIVQISHTDVFGSSEYYPFSDMLKAVEHAIKESSHTRPSEYS